MLPRIHEHDIWLPHYRSCLLEELCRSILHSQSEHDGREPVHQDHGLPATLQPKPLQVWGAGHCPSATVGRGWSWVQNGRLNLIHLFIMHIYSMYWWSYGMRRSENYFLYLRFLTPSKYLIYSFAACLNFRLSAFHHRGGGGSAPWHGGIPGWRGWIRGNTHGDIMLEYTRRSLGNHVWEVDHKIICDDSWNSI